MNKIEEIRARCEAATPGKWEAFTDNDGQVYVSNSWNNSPVCEVNGTSLDPYIPPIDDAEFIAHAGGDNGDVVTLLDEVERLRERDTEFISVLREIQSRCTQEFCSGEDLWAVLVSIKLLCDLAIQED
jgi:hypothetical protein